MPAATVVRHSNGSLLGLFENKELAIESIKYSFHAINDLKTEIDGLSVIVSGHHFDGRFFREQFRVDDWVINNKIQHL